MSRIFQQAQIPAGFKLLLLMSAVCLVSGMALPKDFTGGLCCGAAAFCFSAIGLEKLVSRVLLIGDLGKGVRSSVFWLFFKFLAPGGMIYFGLSKGFSPPAIVLGLTSALIAFTGILWFSREV